MSPIPAPRRLPLWLWSVLALPMGLWAAPCALPYCGNSAIHEPGWMCGSGGGGVGGGWAGGGRGGGGAAGGGCRGCGDGSGSGLQMEPQYQHCGPGTYGPFGLGGFSSWLQAVIETYGGVPQVPYGPGAQGMACPASECNPVGMPAWWVSEPYLSLRLEDEPLGYQPALGPRVAFHLSYRQRGNVPVEPEVFNVGINWSCSFRAWLTVEGTNALVHRGGWGFSRHAVSSPTPDYRDGSLLFYDAELGWVLESRTGARAIFGAPLQVGDQVRHFLSAQLDPTGNGLTYAYSTTGGVVRLTVVTDGDGNTNTLTYGTGALASRIVRVDDPFGRWCELEYDGLGRLTNITDVAGLPTGLEYDADARLGWITNVVTAYGATGFRYGGCDAETEDGFFTAGGAINRVIEVAEPNGGKHLFLYQHTSDRTVSPPVPDSVSALGVAHAFDTAALHERNSYHWGPRQHDALSAAYKSTGNATNLIPADFDVAHLRHWLKSGDGSFLISDCLAAERLPSPADGEEGLWTWYDHPGKPAADTAGTSRLACLVGRVLPDQAGPLTNWLVQVRRNTRGQVTEARETWAQPDGALGVRTNTYTYADGDIDLTIHTGPGGEVEAFYEFNGRHQITLAGNALWETTEFQYDAATGLLTNLIAPSGMSIAYRYDAATHRLLSLTNTATGESAAFSYYANGLPYGATDARGLTTYVTWDALQRPTSLSYPDSTTVSNVYDRLDLAATKDRLGRWTRHAYGAGRERRFTTNAADVVTAYGHCACGGLLYVTNAWGTAQAEGEEYLYDRQGRRTVSLLADGAAVTNTYNALGQVVARTDGWVTRAFHYHQQGLLAAVSTADGVELGVVYDAHDRPVTFTDANGVTVMQTYDALGRLTGRSWPDTGYEQWGYSANLGPATSYTNQLGWETRFVLDAAGRKWYETNANQEVLAYTYTPAGDLWTLSDGKQQVTTWHYDSYGRVTNKFDQTSASILRYTYQADGALATQWSAAKGTTAYSYDLTGNLTNINYPASVDVRLQYDAHGRLTNMVDAVGTSVFGYWPGGALRFEDGPWASDTLTNTYTHGRRTALLLQQPSGSWTNAFGYDPAGRLTNVTSPAGVFSYDYHVGQSVSPASLVRQLLLPNGAYITNNYDAVGRLLSTKLLTSSGVVTNTHTYEYNVASQRTKTARPDASTVSYGYDPIGQLTLARATNAGSTQLTTEHRGYAYDAAWNLAWRTNGWTPSQFDVNAKNELTNSTPSAAQTYDANGNLLTRAEGQWTCAYDDANQLVSLVRSNGALPAAWTELAYDGLGRLRVRREYCWVGWTEPPEPDLAALAQALQVLLESAGGGYWSQTSETRYVYDGRRVIQERDGSNVPVVSYTRGRDLSGSLEDAGGIAGLLARSAGYDAGSGSWSSHACYHADGNGNVTFLLAAYQTLAARYEHDPYGNTLSQTGSLADANVYRFSSKEHHPGTGLYYYGFRWYDPLTQRWMNRDPLDLAELLPEGPNLYAVVGNDPINSVDTYGQGRFKWLDDLLKRLFPQPPKPRGPPKPPKNFKPPTNPAQAPTIPPNCPYRPSDNGRGWIYDLGAGSSIRVMPPSPNYPHGYWILYRGTYPINPRTGKQGPPEDTHVPLPPAFVPAPPGHWPR